MATHPAGVMRATQARSAAESVGGMPPGRFVRRAIRRAVRRAPVLSALLDVPDVPDVPVATICPLRWISPHNVPADYSRLHRPAFSRRCPPELQHQQIERQFWGHAAAFERDINAQ